MGQKAYSQLGWQDLGESANYIKLINPGNLVRQKTGSKFLANIFGLPLGLALRLWNRTSEKRIPFTNINIVEVSYFDRHFDLLWAKLKDCFPICVWRDSVYLNWRYLRRPNSNYKILAARDGDAVLGYIVLRCIDGPYRVGHIIGFIFLPEKEAGVSLLIDAAIDYFKNSGADFAQFQMLANSPYCKLFKSHGFRRYGHGSCWMVKKFVDDGTIDVYDVRNWYLTKGDTDSFIY
jgi:hypothetical protein